MRWPLVFTRPHEGALCSFGSGGAIEKILDLYAEPFPLVALAFRNSGRSIRQNQSENEVC